MAIDTSSLPAAVQNYISTLEKEKLTLEKQTVTLEDQKESYRHRYESEKRRAEEYRRMLFARKSEKLRLSADTQARLFNEAERTASETESVTVKSHRRKRKKSRKQYTPTIPEGLPEIEKRHELSDDEKLCPCCEESMQKIGEDTTKELHVIPEKLVVHKYIYPRYACSKCKEDAGVQSAERNRFLPGTIAGTGLLAFIIQRKYQFGLTLYRISEMFKLFGAYIPRQNMSNWILAAAKKLHPLYKLLKKELLYGPQFAIDETLMQVFREKGRKDSSQSYMWHMRASPPGSGPVCLFHYREGRSAGFLKEWLSDYNGVILTDGWSSYDKLTEALDLPHAGCWAHARRYFHKAYKEDAEDKVAEHILFLIGRLFSLEAIYIRHNIQNKLKWRQRFSSPIVAKIKAILDKHRDSYPPKSRMGAAISYTLGQWPKLTVFLKYSEADIHNNDVERGIRPFVIGRKNWLFAGCPEGAHASAIFYSLVETAKANELNPYDYLTFLFENFNEYLKSGRLSEILPNRITQQTLDSFFAEYGQV